MEAARGIIVAVLFCESAGMSESIEERRKRLIHRSRYTGMKETDILLGSFALQHVPRFSDAELDIYERLLSEQDPDIFDWATGKTMPPEDHNTPILKLLMNHRVA
jgi:succinate dehydrogenase flavin-adding protein (antitoxin of CptAB toxin-antitoxin module)